VALNKGRGLPKHLNFSTAREVLTGSWNLASTLGVHLSRIGHIEYVK